MHFKQMEMCASDYLCGQIEVEYSILILKMQPCSAKWTWLRKKLHSLPNLL